MVLFTIQCALLATVLIVAPGAAVAWLLARRSFPGKALVETLIHLPLVVPPVATGFLLLRLFGRKNGLGDFLSTLGLDVVFTWRGVVVAMAVMAFPLFVRTARLSFESVNHRLEEIARTLGASEWRVFTTITAPLAARGLAAGALLAFARALGEFGATILIAGNIPGRTSTIAVSIYNAVQIGNDDEAARLIAIAIAIAFVAVLISESLLRRRA